jgi:hypothetical protein
MKTKTSWIFVAALGMGLFSGLSSCEKSASALNDQNQSGFFQVTGEGFTAIEAEGISGYFVTASDSLTESEINGLMLMREEEKMARDVYDQLSDLYDLPIFGNIANSETTHFEAVGKLLDYFAIEDPASEQAGSFNNPELQALYDSLVTKGSVSLTSGLQVGAMVEEIDILDLESLISRTNNEDIVMVYTNLLRASRNHLRAFNRQLERNGVDYAPVYLDRESFEAIVTSEMERGGYGGCYGQANSYGKRHGQGQGNGYRWGK